MAPSPFRPADEARVRAAAVVLGAGSGSRVGSAHNKVFLPLAGRRVISWAFQAMAQVETIERFVMVIREDDRAVAQRTIDRELEGIPVDVILGGSSRHASELEALEYLAPDIDAGRVNVVLIHDGARPLIAPALVRQLIETAMDRGAVFPALEVDDGVRALGVDGTLDLTPLPGLMVRAQTPQVFRAAPLLQAYRRSTADGFVGTDTAACFQQYNSEPLQYTPGDARNIKITYPGDLFAAEEILRAGHFEIR